MPIVSTDDAARRQEFIWLGPVNSPWPFEARGRAWIMAVLLCPPLVVAAFVLAPRPLISALIPGPMGLLLTGVTAVALGVGVGVLLTVRIGRVISPTRPLAHHVALLAMEIDAPRQRDRRTHRIHAEKELWIEDEARHRRVRELIPPPFTDED